MTRHLHVLAAITTIVLMGFAVYLRSSITLRTIEGKRTPARPAGVFVIPGEIPGDDPAGRPDPELGDGTQAIGPARP